MTETTPSLFERIGGDPTLRPLLQHFYSDVRQHQIIGPIFLREVDGRLKHQHKLIDPKHIVHHPLSSLLNV